ncbi:MAG: hypothetical protein IPL91_15910 [Hyphomicrobium sp.]|nr:hypothetical protein [Hyphomicrobium sp.]
MDIITSKAPTLLRTVMSRLDQMSDAWQIPFAEIARGGLAEPLNAEDSFRAAMAIAGAEPFRTRFRRWVGSEIHGHVAGLVSLMPPLRRLRNESMRGFLQGGAAPLLPALIDVATSVLKIPEAEDLRPFVTLANSCGYCLPCQDTCYLTDRPEFIKTERGDLHADEGPAVAWPGGAMPMWRWRGLPVAEHVMAPIAAMDARSIRRERSVILRDIMIERFGLERFIRECGAKPVRQDEVGSLWVAEHPVPRRRVTAVEVVNGTAEPDGSYRHYFIRVPNIIRTARGAVAWSYGLTAEQYRVKVRT